MRVCVLFLQTWVSYECVFYSFSLWPRRSEFRDEAVMEGVAGYSGIQCLSAVTGKGKKISPNWPIRSSITNKSSDRSESPDFLSDYSMNSSYLSYAFYEKNLANVKLTLIFFSLYCMFHVAAVISRIICYLIKNFFRFF